MLIPPVDVFPKKESNLPQSYQRLDMLPEAVDWIGRGIAIIGYQIQGSVVKRFERRG